MARRKPQNRITQKKLQAKLLQSLAKQAVKAAGRAAVRRVTKKGKSKTSSRTKRKFRTRHAGYAGRPINVKNDLEGQSRTYYVQKVTEQQQKRINKRFKGDHSNFKDEFEDAFQDTIPQATGKCKWVWRCYNHLDYISRAFQNWPTESTYPGSQNFNYNKDQYVNAQNQAVYFNKFKSTYEIYNPTNYDMNLVIYDLVCKCDTQDGCQNAFWNPLEKYTNNTNTTAENSDFGSPIRQIWHGLNAELGFYPRDDRTQQQGVLVANPTNKTIYDITTKPTESYPFNIYWTIVKKHTYKLQPGATLTHKFIHRPKALLTRGYWGYKYGPDTLDVHDRYNGIKDITSGCLFKFWGQVSGTAVSTGSYNSDNNTYVNMMQDHDDVTTLSGRIMFKEYIQNRWYTMDPQFTYTWRTDISPYTPQDEETLPVVNDDNLHRPEDDLNEANPAD